MENKSFCTHFTSGATPEISLKLWPVAGPRTPLESTSGQLAIGVGWILRGCGGESPSK